MNLSGGGFIFSFQGVGNRIETKDITDPGAGGGVSPHIAMFRRILCKPINGQI